jgi:hypothetical protein
MRRVVRRKIPRLHVIGGGSGNSALSGCCSVCDSVNFVPPDELTNVDQQRQTLKYLFNQHFAKVHLGNDNSRAGHQKTYLPPRDKIYALIDDMVEGTKNEEELMEPVRRWWHSIPDSERNIVHRKLLNVLAKSYDTLEAISGALTDLENSPKVSPSKRRTLAELREQEAGLLG